MCAIFAVWPRFSYVCHIQGVAVSYERGTPVNPAAGEWGGYNITGFQDFRTENGSSQGQNLVLTGLFMPDVLDSG